MECCVCGYRVRKDISNAPVVKELACRQTLLLIVIQLNLGSKLVYAIAVDATKIDSREAWWNQSTLHGMAQRPGGWGQGALHGMVHRALV